jgi:WhiB family transcriptional regulator, redox-sensing transcriptional regulator
MTVTGIRAEWWSLAACLSADPDLFFPVSATGPAQRQVARAKAVCARCRVGQQCLSYALAAGPVHGVWGGTTEDERRLLAIRRARRPRPGAAQREPAVRSRALSQPARSSPAAW